MFFLIPVSQPPGEGGLLVHCISGWDRTPLFVSLIRMSLWAVSTCNCVLECVCLKQCSSGKTVDIEFDASTRYGSLGQIVFFLPFFLKL